MVEQGAVSTINNASPQTSSAAGAHIDTQTIEEEREPILGVPIESAGLVSTAEFEIKDESTDESAQSGNKAQASAKEGDQEVPKKGAEEDADKYSAEELKKLDATFQDSPRFKQLMEERTKLKADGIKSAAKLEALENQVTNLTGLVQGESKPTKQAQQSPAYTDVTQMTDEKIIESFESDPKGFLANFAVQIGTEIRGQIFGELNAQGQHQKAQTQEEEIKKLYDKYENDNPDFVEMWSEGQIQDYMEEHPGLTPIAAHKLLKSEKTSSGSSEAQQKAIDEAVKKAVEEERKNMASKHHVRVIGAGGGSAAQTVITDKTPADLANTKNHGGLTAVLAKRFAARRAQN